MLDASSSETPKTKKKTPQNRPLQRFWPDSIVAGVLQTYRSQAGAHGNSTARTNTLRTDKHTRTHTSDTHASHKPHMFFCFQGKVFFDMLKTHFFTQKKLWMIFICLNIFNQHFSEKAFNSQRLIHRLFYLNLN